MQFVNNTQIRFEMAMNIKSNFGKTDLGLNFYQLHSSS